MVQEGMLIGNFSGHLSQGSYFLGRGSYGTKLDRFKQHCRVSEGRFASSETLSGKRLGHAGWGPYFGSLGYEGHSSSARTSQSDSSIMGCFVHDDHGYLAMNCP